MSSFDEAGLHERLSQLEQVVKQRCHRIEMTIPAGASQDQLTRTQDILGLTLPEALTSFLMLSNGLQIAIFSSQSPDDTVATMSLEISSTERLPRATATLHEVAAVENDAEDDLLRSFLNVSNIHGPRHSIVIPTVGLYAGCVVSAWLDEPFIRDFFNEPQSVIIGENFNDFLSKAFEHAIRGRGGFDYWSADDFIRDPWSL